MTEEEMCEALIEKARAICKTHYPAFSVKRCIGAGASAAVFEIASADKNFALKVYDPKFFSGKNRRVEKQRIRLQLDLRRHGRADLVQIFDAQEINESAFILMELIPWRSLDKELGKIGPPSIRPIISQVAGAARYLEERRMTHRDIKPANIMVSPDHKQAKLLDLGVIRALDAGDEPLSDTGGELAFVATAQYSSPEYLFRLGEHNDEFWRGLTFYQLGGVLHDMIVGVPLFDKEAKTKNKYVLAHAVLFKVPTVPANTTDPSLVRLARSALNKDLRIRLRRVSWFDFSGTEATEHDLRSRLGLGAAASKRADRTRLEALRIQLDEIAKAIRNTLMPILMQQGYPTVTVAVSGLGVQERVLTIEFVPEDPEMPGDKVRAVSYLRPADGNTGVDISLVGYLIRDSAEPILLGETREIWASALDSAIAEASVIAAAVERSLLRIYADAVAGTGARRSDSGDVEGAE